MSFERMRIDRLKAEIVVKRTALAEERAALHKLESEIDSFARLYDRIIGKLEAELDRVRQEIEVIQSRSSLNLNTGSIWGQYSSFEESFDAKYRQQPPQNPKISASSSTNDDELRKLYRKLARKYHPDTTTDPAQKAHLTIIMAQINAAYRARNIDELRAINGDKRGKVAPPSTNEMERLEPGYYELLKESEKLDEEIAWTRSMYARLMHGPLMALKVEASIARSRGRDLLRELASKVQKDLESARAELAKLRAQ